MDGKPKIQEVLKLAQALLAEGRYSVSKHAKLRQQERNVTLADIKNVIISGFHEKRKDQFIAEHRDWNYAIRGKTLDGQDTRVCVSFDDATSMVFITVIRLER